MKSKKQKEIKAKELGGDIPCYDCSSNNNPVWFTDNVLWNNVVGIKDIGLILCVYCFIRRAEKKYKISSWRLLPHNPITLKL